MRARPKVLIMLGVLVLVAAACDWSSVGFDASRGGYSAFDGHISTDNVGGLTEQWRANGGFHASAPAVSNGRVFVTVQPSAATEPGGLSAFDATGAGCTGSAPATCTPLWSQLFPSDPGRPNVPRQDPPISPPLVTHDYVSAGGYYPGWGYLGNNVYCPVGKVTGGSFDLATGAAVTGEVRTGAASAISARDAVYGYRTQLLVSGVFCSTTREVTRLFATVPSGQGTSFVIERPDSEVYHTPVSFIGSAPAVADGRLFVLTRVVNEAGVLTDDQLQQYDANGVQGCYTPSQLDWTCQPQWTAAMRQPGGFDGMPAVAKGRVYVPELNGGVEVFDGAGCGARTCSALWTAHAGDQHVAPVAVTDTTLFVSSDDGHLYAFPSAGCGAASCEPTWSASLPSGPHAPSIAGSVLFVGANNGTLAAFDVDGCGQATCDPIWSANVGAPITTAPAIVDGRVFVTDTTGTIHAFGL